MKIVMHDEEDLEIKEFGSPEFEIESVNSQAHYSALQMFATSIALCTYSVLAGYGEQINSPTKNIVIRIRWSYVEDPFRIGDINMEISWPGLPESRLKAAQRAASDCTLHHTLENSPSIVTQVSNAIISDKVK